MVVEEQSSKPFTNKPRYDEAEKKYYENLAQQKEESRESQSVSNVANKPTSPKRKRQRNASKGSPVPETAGQKQPATELKVNKQKNNNRKSPDPSSEKSAESQKKNVKVEPLVSAPTESAEKKEDKPSPKPAEQKTKNDAPKNAGSKQTNTSGPQQTSKVNVDGGGKKPVEDSSKSKTPQPKVQTEKPTQRVPTLSVNDDDDDDFDFVMDPLLDDVSNVKDKNKPAQPEVTTPVKKQEQVSKKEEHTPKKEEQTPKKEEQTPKKEEQTPKKEEQVPKKEETPQGGKKKNPQAAQFKKDASPAPSKKSHKKGKKDKSPAPPGLISSAEAKKTQAEDLLTQEPVPKPVENITPAPPEAAVPVQTPKKEVKIAETPKTEIPEKKQEIKPQAIEPHKPESHEKKLAPESKQQAPQPMKKETPKPDTQEKKSQEVKSPQQHKKETAKTEAQEKKHAPEAKTQITEPAKKEPLKPEAQEKKISKEIKHDVEKNVKVSQTEKDIGSLVEIEIVDQISKNSSETGKDSKESSPPSVHETEVPSPGVITDSKWKEKRKRKRDELKKDRRERRTPEKMNDIAEMTYSTTNLDPANKITKLEQDNTELKSQLNGLMTLIQKLADRISNLENQAKQSLVGGKTAAAPPVAPAKTAPAKPAAPAKPVDDDDDVDLFGEDSEEEDEASKKIKEQRLAEYAAKKSKKPTLIAKSNIILDVKPWGDETDMKKMEEEVRKITMDGLVWGASKLAPLAFGLHKLQISCVVEDEKVSVDLLTETIEAIEELVQSVDIAAFNKV